MGCTIGAFFTGWPAFSGGAIMFAVGLVVGVYAAVRYLVWEAEKAPTLSAGGGATYLAAAKDRTSLQPFAGLVVLCVGVAVGMLYDPGPDKDLMGFALTGLLIGIVLHRSRFCIVAALREPFITGDSKPAQAIIAGILVGLFGFLIIKGTGVADEGVMVTTTFWLPGLLGGIIFGVGMTVAGGCTIGATWRSGEGHVKLWLALAGVAISMPLAAEYLRPAMLDALPSWTAQELYLPDAFGYGGAVCLIILLLLLWYMLVKWNEHSGKLSVI
jgi:uncharacterized membrane protein YedE/YeeE